MTRPRSPMRRVPLGAWVTVLWCVAAAAVLRGRFGLPRMPSGLPAMPAWAWPAIVTAVVAAVVAGRLLARRPVLSLVLLAVASVTVSVAAGRNADEAEVSWFLISIQVALAYLVAMHPPWTWAPAFALILVILPAAARLGSATADGHAWFWLTFAVMPSLVAGLIGYSLRQARSYARRLSEQAAAQAVVAERLRISRELHDQVAHSVGIIALQAGAAARVLDTHPEDARAAMRAVEATGRETLSGLRHMLLTLREPGPAPRHPAPAPPHPPPPQQEPALSPHPPSAQREPVVSPGPSSAQREPLVSPGPSSAQREPLVSPGPPSAQRQRVALSRLSSALPGSVTSPYPPPVQREPVPSPHPPSVELGSGAAFLHAGPGLADVERLAAVTTAAGVRVDLQWRGRPRPMPPEVDLSAYRIIQESLTNVMRHAGAATCSVAVDYLPDALAIEVTDAGHSVAPASAEQVATRDAAAGRPSASDHPSTPDCPASPDRPSSPGLPSSAGRPSSPGLPSSAGRPSSPDLPSSAGPPLSLGRCDAAVSDEGGFGLAGLRERVALLCGTFSAGARPGGGFRVTARLPAREPA
ncbi:histidine kinase [Actinoplanes sp. CA-030573]|uniref:sensor histidine kinase n=1 Tax=Actinoplanes sp. CA-030573 TaxID=3239898 RepID=UPI003D8BA4DB